MADFVIDTNVWVMADRPLKPGIPREELDCIQACSEWLQNFVSGTDRLVVDLSYRILNEYRGQISKGGSVEQILNKLESAYMSRMKHVEVAFDEDDTVLLPDSLAFHDPADRKFIAASLGCTPPAPIYNATDTDWTKEREQLIASDIIVEELCPEYIAATRDG